MLMVFTLIVAGAVAWAAGVKEPAATETAPEAPAFVTVTDSAGREVELAYPVTRAVITYSQLLLIAKGVGVSDESIVGLDAFTKSGYETIFTGLAGAETVGKNLFNLDVEKIISLKPQVLISTSSTLRRNAELESQLDAAGIKFVGLDFDWDNVSNIIDVFGTMFGEEAQAATFDEFWWSVIDAVAEKVASLPEEEKVTVYWENTATGYTTIGKGSANDEMLTMAGGVNLAGTFTESSPKVDPEWIISRNPEVILKYPMGATDQGGFGATATAPFQAMLEEIIARPGFDEIAAVKEGEVYIVSQLIKTGAFQNIAVLYIAKILYPELFTELDPETKLREMVEKYMGLDWDDVDGVFVYPER